MRLTVVMHLNDSLGDVSGPLERARRINKSLFDVIICSYYDKDQHLESLANEIDMEVIGLGARSWFDLGAWNRMIRIIKNRKVAIIHTHHHRSGLLGRVIGKFRSGTKIVHSFGNIWGKFSWYSRLAHILTFSLVDYFVCVSESVKNSFGRVAKKLLKNKKILIYNGIDVSEVEREKGNSVNEREKMGIKNDEYLVGNVARLFPLKDQKTLIRAIAGVIKDNPKVKLVIVGNGKLEKELKDLARGLGIKKNVVFTGLVERKRVYRILHALDLFVMTSLWEGFCVAVLQAMAAGLPMILTDIPSFREVIKDGVSGRLVPLRDHIALAGAIKEMINNSSKAIQMGAAAKKRVKKEFTIERTVESYKNLYIGLLR